MRRGRAGVGCICLCLVLLALSGCIDMDLKVRLHRDLSADFSQKIVMDRQLAEVISLEEPKDDFWTRMRRLSKERGWVLQEKAANHLVVSGRYTAEQVRHLGEVLSEQATLIAEGFGYKPRAPQFQRQLVPSTTDFHTEERLLDKLYHLRCELDLTAQGLRHRTRLPENFEKSLTRLEMPPALGTVALVSPYPIVSTNGRVSGDRSTASWTLVAGRRNVLAVTMQSLDWTRLLVAALALLSVLAGALALLLRLDGGKQQQN